MLARYQPPPQVFIFLVHDTAGCLMKTIKLDDINIHDIGNSIQISGTLWSGKGISFITLLPQKDVELGDISILPLTLDEWKTLIKQTDVLETEMLRQDSSGITKILFRKSQRQLDSYMQWAVFKRDNYTCRYCGHTGVPLTVDHIILWEEGGPTIEENLLSACRGCNKDRGNMQYENWVSSPVYMNKSRNLPVDVREANINIIPQLDHLKSLCFTHTRSR